MFRLLPTLALTLFLAGCGLFEAPAPPMARLQNARDALERARRSGAIRHSETAYRNAEHLIAIGWNEIGRQNGRIYLFRNYTRADSILLAAEIWAERGARAALDSLALQELQAREAYIGLEEELKIWREALNGTLILYSAERWWSQAGMHLRTARRLFQDGEYTEAVKSAALGRKALARVGALLAEQANHEATQMIQWRNWVEETIAWSRDNDAPAIIVDKTAHRTYLIKNGKTVRTYASDVGYNSASQKHFSGDGATPEGQYQISKVKDGNSKFYRALLINYPNDSDRKRFEENKRRGIISRNARIGGLIEIHGDGGHGRDWTDGCVALANSDMDNLIPHVRVGTPVTIVRRYDGKDL
ncbi:MAG: murein L,D-transpeptidase [Calditrichaeota bacterium]|nr:murein L,D-transpeptidase [Calditrichota bacterium]